MFGIGKWTTALTAGVMAIAIAGIPASSTSGDDGQSRYRQLDDLTLTAATVEGLEQAAVDLAHELGDVPLDPDQRSDSTSGTCPLERLEVSWQAPVGYERGSYVGRVGPRPDADSTQATGVVICEGSHYAFMGFEAEREQDGLWHLAATPSIATETGLGHVASSQVDARVPARASTETDASPLASLGPIDDYAAYQPQRICDPRAKPGAVALAQLLLTKYPSTSNFGIIRPCDIGDRSEHKEGRAFDWGANVTSPEQRAAVENLLSRLLATDADGNEHALARRLGVMYIIWNNSIWSSYRHEAGWRPYYGPSAHTDHLHVSLSWDGAMGETSLWQATLPTGWWSALPAIGDVALPPDALTGTVASQITDPIEWQRSWRLRESFARSDRNSSSDTSSDGRPSGDASSDPSGGSSPSDGEPSESHPWDPVTDAVGETGGAATDTVEDVEGTAEDLVDEATETVNDTVDDVDDTVEDTTGRLPTPAPTPGLPRGEDG